ncbi:hypothetical protein J4E83_010065 [Alternaria metachromatica]|uniref:uncharacterized protein n=1 Tax=Alternaria metachromatica TaxID=283354 RepID=UPI0020C3D0AA|nr:uncharacterized protein J4E83_010065 [Alternaria metachromatica]KAI4606474.1 hypothetical protein J4E83_010065 [Alternaria metachromatica]
MPSMASSIHPDFRDDVTSAEAHAVDRETERLIHQQLAADNASGRERYIQLAKEMLRIRLRAYKPESPPVAGAWCLIGSAHLKASQLQEAKEATEKSLEIYAAGNDAEKENSAALAREQLGLIFEGLGQISDAKKIRLQGASDGTMVCSSPRVTYYQRNYGNRVDPNPAPVYQNESSHVGSMGHVDFDTISEEVVAKKGRLGLTPITLTQVMFPIWQSKGFKLLSKEASARAASPRRKSARPAGPQTTPTSSRRRNINNTPDLQANSKKPRRNTISTPLTPEDKAAAKRAFQDTTKPIDEQSIHNFQVTEAEAHESGHMPTFVRMPRQWALDTNTDQYDAPAFGMYRVLEDMLNALVGYRGAIPNLGGICYVLGQRKEGN